MHIHRETERERIWKSSWKELWNSKLIRQILVVYLWQKIFTWSIKFWIYEILLGQLKRASTSFIFVIKIKLSKSYQKDFLFYRKSSFFYRRFQIFVLHYSPLLYFLGHCWFYWRSWLMINTKVYGISMSLIWIFKTLIL